MWLDDQVPVVRELEPRRDAAVVVERGDEDLVARRNAAPAVRESVKLSEVMFGPKIDLVRLAAEEPRGLALGLLEDLP